MPGSGEQRTQHWTQHSRALQHLFFIKSFLSRAEDTADFLNMEKQTRKGRENEETEKFIPNERTGQGHGWRI